jgi:hypothetical protein
MQNQMRSLIFFSDGPNVNIADLVSMLSKVAPMYSSKWKNIKF